MILEILLVAECCSIGEELLQQKILNAENTTIDPGNIEEQDIENVILIMFVIGMSPLYFIIEGAMIILYY